MYCITCIRHSWYISFLLGIERVLTCFASFIVKFAETKALCTIIHGVVPSAFI